jgi:hypothetical protein
MRDLTDVRIRRGLLVLAAALLCVAVAGPAQAKEEKINFLPGVDVSSWYWVQQVDEEVTTPDEVTIPPPVPPASQRARLPSPQRPDTLPVGLRQGEQEKKAAIKFNLLERGVTEGSQIKKLLLFMEESPDRNEQPQVRPELAKIQACRITEFLTQGEVERFEDAPKVDDKDCVDGTRELGSGGAAAVWTWDLTKMADAWGKNPFENYGVMLLGTGTDTWQVNLKVPRKDTPAEEGDQYELTKERAFVSIDYIPGEPVEIPEAPEVPVAPPAPSSSGTGTVPSSTDFGTSGSPVVGPSTDLVGNGEIPGAETAPPEGVPTEQAGFLTPQAQGPRMPAYVWLIIPLGLLGLAAVRSVVLEPVGGPRPDGVISAIRRRNAERRGGALVTSQGPLARATSGFKRSVGEGFSSLTRSLRRKR